MATDALVLKHSADSRLILLDQFKKKYGYSEKYHKIKLFPQKYNSSLKQYNPPPYLFKARGMQMSGISIMRVIVTET